MFERNFIQKPYFKTPCFSQKYLQMIQIIQYE